MIRSCIERRFFSSSSLPSKLAHLALDLCLGILLALVLFFVMRSLLARAAEAGSILRATLESTTDGILVVNRAGKITSYNRKFAGLWRLSTAVLEAGDDEQALAAVLGQLREPEKFLAKVKALYRQPEAESVDDLELKDGQVFERHSLPQRLHGEVVGRVWSFHDVTAERRAAATLKASEDRYRTLFDCSPAGVLRQDEAGNIIDVNAAFTQMTGYARAELLGQPVTMFVADSGKAAAEQNLKKILAGGVHVHEVENRTKSGWMMFFKIVETCVEFPDGHREILCNVNNISDRSRSERLLEQQRQALESIANGMPLAETLTALCRMVESQCEGALASILLLDEDERRLRHGAAPSLPEAYCRAIDGVAIGPAVGSCGTAAFLKQQVIVEDIATDPLWKNFAALADKHSLRACWSTPILDAAGKVLGTFAIYERIPSRPEAADLKLIESITHLSAVAISKERSEASLRESEARLSTIFHSSPDGIVIARLENGLILDANEAYAKTFGYPLAEMLGRTTLELNLWANPVEHDELIASLRRHGRSEEREIKFRRQNGTEGDLLASVGLISLAGQECLLAMTRDFTDRKQAQLAVAESEQRIRELFELSPDAIFVESVDGRVLDVSEAACRLHALPREKLTGMMALELIPEEYRAAAAAALPRLGTDDLRMTEGFSLAADGRKIPVEIIARRITYAGQPALLINARDISERKCAEARAALQQARFKLIFDTMPIGIAFNTKHPDGSVTRSINEAHLHICGITREQSNDPKIYQAITHPDDRPAQLKLMSEANHGPSKLFSIERRYVRADNSIVWVSLSFQREIYPDGTVEELTTIVDITQRKRLEEQLRQSQKMEAIGQLSGGIAHDFNNILTAILGNATLLSDPMSSPEEIQECVQEITRAARRAADLTRQLLLFSRKQAMQPSVLDLNHTVSHSLKMLRRILGEDIAIQADLAPGIAPVFADSGMIGQVILNLAVNARDAMPRGGRIQIRTRIENTRHPRPPPARRPRPSCASPSRTTARASPRKFCRASSSRSSPPRKSARAPASASPPSTASCNSTTAGSPSPARPAKAQSSKFFCRSSPASCPPCPPRPRSRNCRAASAPSSWPRTNCPCAASSPPCSNGSATPSCSPPTAPRP